MFCDVAGLLKYFFWSWLPNKSAELDSVVLQGNSALGPTVCLISLFLGVCIWQTHTWQLKESPFWFPDHNKGQVEFGIVNQICYILGNCQVPSLKYRKIQGKVSYLPGTSLVVQWILPCDPNAGGLGLNLVSEPKSYILQLSPSATTTECAYCS